ncbi:MAG: bifunctional diaminohydroxyphosphoribosylaminopyrimidine deaminase/5-amino-6-(5-phosphoribosylamino)uracil reductase RibD [Sphingomonadales bacterium]|nr:bifunctional diaminohydroxyphosphoribosylaminopyrimidine deaminase/5-amino-6-(5-phosphoribosylamino)uracil reductase RibD [Sphingomonadales bacterium]
MSPAGDQRWLAAAAALADRARPLSRPNPAVGAILVRDGTVIARGHTQPGGRPHAEAVALAAAGDAATGATLYVTLEPCAHQSRRGPACADLVAASGVARVVVGCPDPDPRTAGQGIARIADAGIAATLVDSAACAASLAGYLARCRLGRPHVTLKLATSLDGAIALANGTSQWITGSEARTHAHAQRARVDAIVVGGATLRADAPALTVRLPGLESRAPLRCVLTGAAAPDGWHRLATPAAIAGLADAQYVIVEGGARTAAAFLAADLVDSLHLYRAPILIGGGLSGVADIGLADLGPAHGRWRQSDHRRLGNDSFEAYERTRI